MSFLFLGLLPGPLSAQGCPLTIDMVGTGCGPVLFLVYKVHVNLLFRLSSIGQHTEFLLLRGSVPHLHWLTCCASIVADPCRKGDVGFSIEANSHREQGNAEPEVQGSNVFCNLEVVVTAPCHSAKGAGKAEAALELPKLLLQED